VRVRPRPLLLGLLAVLLVALALFSAFYDPEALKAYFIAQVEQQLGRKIEVGATSLSLFPRIRLDLSDVVIREIDPSRAFFKAKKVELVLRSTPLWRLRVVVKRLHIDQPQVELRRDAGGHWNFLAAAPAVGKDTTEGGNPFGLILLVQETTLVGGELSLVDEFRPDGTRSLQLKALDAVMLTGAEDFLVDLRLTAAMPAVQGDSSLSLIGKVTRFESPVHVTATSLEGPRPSVQFQGLAEAKNIDIRPMADFFGPRPTPEVQGAADLRSTIHLTPGVGGYDLVLSAMALDVGRLSLRGQASLSGLMTAQPTFSLTFSSSPVQLDELLARFPAEWVHPQLGTVMADREISGTVEVVSASLTGTTKPELRASLTGEFRLQQGHALVGSDRTPIENLACTIVAESDRVRITELSGQYGPMVVTGGKATVSFLEAGPWLDLDVAGDMAAADLASFLIHTISPGSVTKTLAGLRQVQGKTAVTFRLAGSVGGLGSLKFIGGEVVAQNVGFRSSLLHDPTSEVNGRVIFSPQSVELDGVSGRLGQGRLELQGTIAIDAAPRFKDFHLRASAQAAQILKEFPTIKIPSQALQGVLGAIVDLSGPAAAPRIKAEVELKDAALRFSESVRKPAGLPASLRVEVQLSPARRLTIERLEAHLPPFRLTGKGTLQLGTRFAVEASIVSGPASLAGLPPGISLGNLDAGTAELTLDIKGRGTNWKAWQYSGWIALTGGRLRSKELDAPVSDIYLRLQLVRGGADVKRLAFKVKDSDISLSGSVRNWDRTPAITMQAQSSQLDIDLLSPKGERSPVRDVLEELAATGRVAATVTIDRGYYKTLSLRGLSTQVNIRDGTVMLDNLAGEVDGGPFEGRLKVLLPKLKPADVQASFRIREVRYEKILRLFEGDRQVVAGDLSASGTLQGNGRDPKGTLHSLNGKVNLFVTQGHIYKGTAIAKILTILNLPTLLQGKVDLTKEGMPFDKVSATFTVANGIVATENFLVDSPILKITGAGNYDLARDRLNAVVVASPLGSYTKLIQSIPLFGKLFAGERQGFTTAFFEVTGPFRDPQVDYMPLKSFGTGVTGLAQLAFDLLKNTITLPKELIAPSDESPASPETSPPPDIDRGASGSSNVPAPATP
jgi:hypothetical protein